MELTLDNRIAIGRWWFQNRSLSPLPVLMLILLWRPDFELTFPLFLLGVLGVCAGEMVRLWAVGYAGSSTRTRGETVPSLIQQGPYRWTRNPLYVGNILLYVSFSFLFGHLLLTGLALIYFGFQYALIVGYEEKLLRERFVDEYFEYCARVPRWLTGHRELLPRRSSSLKLRAAIRSERSTLIAIGSVWILWLSRFLWQRH